MTQAVQKQKHILVAAYPFLLALAHLYKRRLTPCFYSLLFFQLPFNRRSSMPDTRRKKKKHKKATIID